MTESGPAWLGIGAQRSGTTWFCDLLLQHPQMNLSDLDRKELHELYRPDVDVAVYRSRFTLPNSGEWTPFYLRAPWVPEVAAEAVGEETPLLAILRDPVERFASAMRLETTRGAMAEENQNLRTRLLHSDAIWAGMYATQLDIWATVFGEGRIMVLQYERIVGDPQIAVESVWERLGLPSVQLEGVDQPSRTATQPSAWEWPADLRNHLRTAYTPQVRILEDRWGIDSVLWPNFSD